MYTNAAHLDSQANPQAVFPFPLVVFRRPSDGSSTLMSRRTRMSPLQCLHRPASPSHALPRTVRRPRDIKGHNDRADLSDKEKARSRSKGDWVGDRPNHRRRCSQEDPRGHMQTKLLCNCVTSELPFRRPSFSRLHALHSVT